MELLWKDLYLVDGRRMVKSQNGMTYPENQFVRGWLT
jgi:hypothetical protein